MSQHGPKLIDLFEKATSDELKEPDYGLNIEIADRMNSRRRYCLEGIEYFKQLFRSTDLKTIELTLSLLETCVKNCNSHFHRYLSNREFIPSFTQLLKRRRRKLNLVEKMAGLYKNPGWRKVEDRVLCLIQLWADTFMMHEDTYPSFMKIYRELRKEGLKFPARDPNERFMIKFDGDPSPAFELADMEQQLKGSSERDVLPRKVTPPRAKAQARGLDEDEEPKLMQSDIDALKRNLPLLEDIIARTRDVRDLQETSVKEVVRNCRSAQKKLIWVISYKASNSTDERETVELLGIMDFINSKMESFKTAVGVIKRGGSNKEVLDVLKGKTNNEDNLLDLGEDFLEIQENPLDKLEKYVWGRRPEPERIPEVKAQPKTPPPEIPRIEEPPMPGRKLAPLPDLLLDEAEDYTPTPHREQENIYDLHSIFAQPVQPPPQPIYQTPGFNPQMQGQSQVTMGYPPAYQNPSMPQQMYNPQLNQAYPQQPFPQPYSQPPQAAQRDEFEDFFAEIANRR